MKPRCILFYCVLLLAAIRSSGQPVEFVQNKGQWGNWFNYKAATPAGDVLLEKDGFRYVLQDEDNNYKMDYYHHGQTKEKPVLKFHVYKVTFEGAKTPVITGEKEQKVYYNYFLGSDSSRWKTGIHPCRDVNYSSLYDGVDMHVTSEKGNITYEFFVRPNADASQLKMRFDGQNSIKVKDGNLVVSTSVGNVTEMKPYAYQYIDYNRVEVPCTYQLKGNLLTYEFPKGYDHSQQLIIDPIVLLCTLSGSTADNWGYTATYDDAGNFYAGGLVNTLEYGGTYPVSPGAFQTTFGGGMSLPLPMAPDSAYASDIAIIKYDATLTTRVYATYLGGSGNDHVHSMIVDPAGDLIIAGRTTSPNYPVTPTAYQTTNHGEWDIVVTKFNPTGTALVGSTYMGGSGTDGVNYDSTEYAYGALKYNYGDDSRSEVQLDNAGNIYVAGCTNSTNFPTTATAISTALSGPQDGVVFKLNSTLSTLIWSTYIGGSNYDAGYSLAFDSSQASVYVSGGTNSTDFPATAGALHTTFQGGRADGFIMKFKNSAPYSLQKSTYIGTSNYDQVFGIQVSSANEVYAMGQSVGGLFPVTAGVYSNPNSTQFAIKLDSNLSTDVISTVFGSGNPTFTNISPVAFLVDTCNNLYISGWGGNLNIPASTSGECTGMPVTSDAQQSTTDGRDFYFIVLGSGMSTLRYATFYGRYCNVAGEEWEGEHVDGGTSRFSKHGIIYQGICASCGGAPGTSSISCPAAFPTTLGVWSTTDSSFNCNEAALKIAFNIGPVTATITAGPSTSGCAPLTVNFTNTSYNGLTFVWNYGDGSAVDTSYSPSHTFTTAGTFTVTLAAANTNACFRTNDTARYVIVVDTSAITPSFTYLLTDSCGPYIATFTNTSTSISPVPSTYDWSFGDGGTYTGATPPAHNYADTGSYTVTLHMANADACNSPQSVTETVHIYNTQMSAKFTIPDSICEGVPFSPVTTIVNADTTTWTFGNGQGSANALPSIVYDSVGTFTVTLVADNSQACTGSYTVTASITVMPTPIANFSYIPITPEANTPTTFTNLSVNATKYTWDFGDNTTSNEVNPVHQYTKTGIFKACLTAYNSSNCPSVLCREVSSDIEPLVGLPSGFSPNKDGENDILYVRGAAIQTMDLKIFNRWGQLVFETNSQSIGWDGTFNGQPQPMDAYAYVLNVTFIDSSTKTLKGSITLLR